MSESQAHIPIRAITTGPGYHWFGYYDKLQFDPGSRYVLAMAVDFEHRAPRPGDEIRIGMIDLEDGDAWRPLGTTSAWCWQQGCMLQWLPGSATEVIWNERAGDRYVARITDTATGASRTVPAPVYALSPDGRTAVGPDFRRLNDMRPGYGYEGIPDPWADQIAPEESGIHTVDLDTGETRQIISVADAAAVPYPHGDLSRAKHYFNHLLFSPDGSRFIFLHRWRTPGERGMRTRMFTAAADGSDLHVVDDYGRMSHFIWRDPETILAWSWQPSHQGAFYVYRDRTDQVEVIGNHAMTLNGHCTYLSDPDWILNDCYPREGTRTQELYLYHVPTATRVELGGFRAPEAYRDESRCDLHPRSDPSGRLVTIDSAHAGGRQLYLLDIAAATADTNGHAVRHRPAVSDLPWGNRTK